MTAAERLAAAWRELEADALASDGPIRDRDVRDAIKRNRARIEAAARESMTQDELDGAALHRLREALPHGWTFAVFYYPPPEPWSVLVYDHGSKVLRIDAPTIAAAADACREAIEAWAIEAQR